MLKCRGFALCELVGIVVVVAVLASMLLVMGDGARRNARLGEDLSKMRQIGAATMAYGSDSGDHYPTFTWQPQVSYYGFSAASSATEAARLQLTYILWTHADRPEIPSLRSLILLPHFVSSHLVLSQHMGWSVPEPLFISSADRHRLLWAADPAGYDAGQYSPNFGTGGMNARHPYSASFRVTTAYFDKSPVGQRMAPNPNSSSSVFVLGASLSAQRLSMVAHPGQKVMKHDTVARHFGPKAPFATHEEARLPLLMADGSAGVRAAADANLGGHPNDPSDPTAPTTVHFPAVIDPPPLTTNDVVYGRFIWTRMLLAGRDFGGPEVWP